MILQNNTHRGEEWRSRSIRKICVENRCWAIRMKIGFWSGNFLCLSWFEFFLHSQLTVLTFLIQSKSDFIPLLYTDVRWNNLVFWHLRWELRTFHFRLRSATFNETVWNLIRFHMKICLRQSKLARVRYFTFLTSIIVTSHNTGTYYTYSQHTSKTLNVIWDGNCLLVHEECKAWSKRFLWGNVIKYCRTSSSSANIFSFNLSQTSHTRTTLAVVRCSHEILRLFFPC